MSDVAFVKRQSFFRWKWKKTFDGLDIQVYIVFSGNPISENTLIGYVQMEKLLLSMFFFSFFVYTALNTLSTLTFPFICWFYVHRITYFFLFMTINSFCKGFMSTLDDLDMQNLIYLNIVCFFWNYRVCTLTFPFKFCQKNSEKNNNDSSKVFCRKIPILLNLSLIINLLFNWIQAYEWMKVIS